MSVGALGALGKPVWRVFTGSKPFSEATLSTRMSRVFLCSCFSHDASGVNRAALLLSDTQQPFLFYVGGDSSRNVSSSQWTTMVKECFARFSPGKIGVPPKLLR